LVNKSGWQHLSTKATGSTIPPDMYTSGGNFEIVTVTKPKHDKMIRK
jgi:hypothetical protein